jgi:ATP-binding cassette subfamily B protein
MVRKLFHLSYKGSSDLKKSILSCVITDFALIFPVMIIIRIISELLKPFTAGVSADISNLWLLAAAAVVAAAVYWFACSYEYEITYGTAYRESEKTRIEVAEHMRKLPLSFFNRKDLAELTTNIMADCTSIEHAMSHVVPFLIGHCISITLVCLMIAFYDWRMALAVYCALPLSALIICAASALQTKYGGTLVRAKLDVSDKMQEYLEGIKVIKAFCLEGENFESLNKAFKKLMRTSMFFEALVGSFIAAAVIVMQTGIGIVVFAGVHFITGGTLGIIPFLIFLLITLRIYSPLIVVMELFAEFRYINIATGRMQSLREEPLMDGDGETVLKDGNIEFHNVTFKYNEENVLKNISFSVKQGEITAFVGPSGSGKSTIFRLLPRFWDIDSGKITVGGKNIKEIEPERLMSYMSFVFQDVVLFNDTVYNNIKIGKMNASKEEIINAAKTAGCDDFIKDMPDGYETMLGENGCTISGGERQRISIARAILKNAPIVLLDEATASLDSENELKIQQAISALVKGRTVLVIAHRLKTIAQADKIIVLNNGEIAEEGTSESLILKKGLYAHLYNIQQLSSGWSVKK